MHDNISYWLNMGNALFYGRDGAVKNPEKARRWFEMAAAAGSDEAKEMLKAYSGNSSGLNTEDDRRANTTKNNLREKYGRLLDILMIYGPKIVAAGYGDFYFCEKIPKEKLKDVLESYARGVKAETVIGLIDVSFRGPFFRKAKSGMVFTTAGLYYDQFLFSKFHLNYKEVDKITITNDNEDCKDEEKEITILLKDGTTLENATSICFNKTPLMNYLKEAKKLAEEGYVAETDSVIDYISSDIPEEYKSSCHKIIHASATSAAVPAAGLAQVPCSDTFFITPIQISMIVALGNVFNMRIGESAAKSILTGVAASLAGRSMSQFLIGWFPGWGNALNATTAIAVTETIGWMAANHFYNIKLEEDNRIIDALHKNDDAHGEKDREMHESFESQSMEGVIIRNEYDDILQGYEKLMDDKTLKERHKAIKEKSDKLSRNMQKIVDESKRVADLSKTTAKRYRDLDLEFERITGFNETDTKFLFFATALQVSRWFLLGLFNEWSEQKLDDMINNRLDHDDKWIKDYEREKRDEFKKNHYDEKKPEDRSERSEKHRSFLSIAFDGVPYDVTVGSPKFGVNMEGALHRRHTLGHDPVLGWLFGTINILSDTITLDKEYQFRTFDVAYQPKPKHWERETDFFSAFSFAVDSIREDKRCFPAAVFAQMLHLESDLFTKKGLPLPLTELIDSTLASKLYKEGYDALRLAKDIKNVAVIGAQAIISVLINLVVSLLHGLYYDFDSTGYENRDIYEVKTRNILRYSNLIATEANLFYVGGRYIKGDEYATKSLDIGGILVTIYHLVNDNEFIRRVKREFIVNGLAASIKGKPLELEKIF